MTLRVLVFESDPVFAEELRTQFGTRGCTTTVVDDGNVGLQQAISQKPDLVLLSIELPRMNGFSVCNKLKKDPNLKDVPLIIMSSESSEETFEQHKKLRTRAEDYVEKPIAFGELLRHVERFVRVPAPRHESDAPIVIEDEIEVTGADYLLEEESAAAVRPPPERDGESARPPRSDGTLPEVSADVEAFAETAFGRLTTPGSQTVEGRPEADVSAAAELDAISGARASAAPAGARRPSVRPAPGAAGDPAERERLRAETIALRERLDAAQRDLADALRDVEKLRLEADEAGRLSRETDELRAKLAAAARAGGTSSRDFLDLREALNRKDKEILALREKLSGKDREIVEARDRGLGLEREKADVEERLLVVERRLAEEKEARDELASDREGAKRAADELRVRLEKAKIDVEARERQLSELRAHGAEERAAVEVRIAAVRAEVDQLLANERAEHARSLDQAEQRRRAEVEPLRRERDGALTEARSQVEREMQEALETQAAELAQEHESRVAGLQRTHTQELERIREESTREARAAADELSGRHAEELRALAEERDARLAAREEQATRDLAELGTALEKVQGELSAARAELSALADRRRVEEAAGQQRAEELERRLADAQSARDTLAERLSAAGDRTAALERELEELRRELAETKERLLAEISRSDHTRAKWDADRLSLDRAKDALALALAQIEEAEARPLA